MAASRGSNIVFQKELAINTADWLADKDGMGFGKLYTLMEQTCGCVFSKVTETIQTIPFFFSPISTFTSDCFVLAESCSELAVAFQGLHKCLEIYNLGKVTQLPLDILTDGFANCKAYSILHRYSTLFVDISIQL